MNNHDACMLPRGRSVGSGKIRLLPYVLTACWLGLLSVQAFSQPIAQGQEKFLGCGTNSNLSRYLERHFNQMTPGNDGKWQSVENIRGQYDWTNLDKIYNYAVKKAFPFREHTLVWMSQQPSWIASLDSAAQRNAVEKWIKAVGERYPLMTFVDVVNEPLHGAPSYKKGLGGDGKTGWDWVITAFELARRYCAPGVKLCLNEYNVLQNSSSTTDYIGIVNLLKDRGLIDGIGVQGHYFEFRSHTDAATNVYVWDINTIKSNLDRLAATGLPVYITEFDIDEQNDANQLAQYQAYFPIFWQHPGVKGITFWGYIQNDVWNSHPYTYLLLTDGTERPALQWLRTYISSTSVPGSGKPLEASDGLPGGFAVGQNYPNPFNPATTIEFSMAVDGPVQLKVFDITGGEIQTLVNGRMDAGRHAVQFNAADLNSGMYFYRIRAGDFIAMKKMIVAK